MTSPLTYAPKTNHELSTLQWGWSSNKLSALSKAIGNVAGTPPSPLARPAYHPTLWTRAQETWDLISRTEVMEQATSDPVLNEWLALLWGLCTKQIHSAYLAESQEVVRLVLDDGRSLNDLQRELHFVLKRTRPKQMVDEPILLFYVQLDSQHHDQRVWVGGYDPRCLVFAASLTGASADVLVEKGLAKVQGDRRRLWVDLDQEMANGPELVKGFIAYLEDILRDRSIQEGMRVQLRNLVTALDSRYGSRLQDLERPTSKDGVFSADPDFPRATLAISILRTLLVRVKIESDQVYPQLKLAVKGSARGVWIRSREPEYQPNQAFVYDQPPGSACGKKLGEAAYGPDKVMDWVDPILAFVAPQAFQFEDVAAGAGYLPLKPEVLNYYTPQQIRESFSVTRTEKSLRLTIDLRTLDPGRSFRKEINFSAAEGSEYRLIRFSPANASEMRPLALAVWPRFRHPGWTDYLMQQKLVCPGLDLVFHRRSEQGALSFERVSLDAKPTLFPIPGGLPDFIEVCHEGKAYGGFFPIVPDLQDEPGNLDRLVVDLGSTNTTVAMRRFPNDDTVLVNLNIQDSFLDLIGHATDAQIADLPYKDVLGLTPDDKDPVNVIPTTPMMTDGNSRALENLFPALKRQDLDYPKKYFKHTRIKGGPDWRFQVGIKSSQSEDVQKAFMRSLLTLIRGHLSAKEGRLLSWDHLIMTYPLSMQAGVTYAKNLYSADPLFKGTDWGTDRYAVLSESEANFEFLKNHDSYRAKIAQTSGGYLLIMDMGGGTTDFSVVNRWNVVSYDSLGPRGRQTGFNEPCGGNIMVPLLEKALNQSGRPNPNSSTWNLSRLLAHVADEIKKSPQALPRELLEFSLQGKIKELTTSDSTDFQVRIAVLCYLMFYYGSIQILSHATRLGDAKTGEEVGAKDPLIKTISLYLPGAGWKIMDFLHPWGNWEVPMFKSAFKAAQANYCPGVKLEPGFSPPLKNEEVPKASVALGAARKDAYSTDITQTQVYPPTGISLKGLKWSEPWAATLETPQEDDFVEELVPNPMYWTKSRKEMIPFLEDFFPGLNVHQAFFMSEPHLQALKDGHEAGMITMQQEISRLENINDGPGTRTPFGMYLEGFYRSYFLRPIKFNPQ